MSTRILEKMCRHRIAKVFLYSILFIVSAVVFLGVGGAIGLLMGENIVWFFASQKISVINDRYIRAASTLIFSLLGLMLNTWVWTDVVERDADLRPLRVLLAFFFRSPREALEKEKQENHETSK